MQEVRRIFRSFAPYVQHPIGRQDRLGTVTRIARWQVGSRLLRMPVVVPFACGSVLAVETGMRGATGNIYVGLMEFEDMSFVLHSIDEHDVLVDVGANVGVYSILGASRGAHVLAVEPIAETVDRLRRNVALNMFDDRVAIHALGLAERDGEKYFTVNGDACNHVLGNGDDPEALKWQRIRVTTLDEITREDPATAIKIDVEGLEYAVLMGGSHTLAHPGLRWIIVELNGSGSRYGVNDIQVHKLLLDYGYSPIRYLPFERKIVELRNPNSTGNTIYVKDIGTESERVRAAESVRLLGLEY